MRKKILLVGDILVDVTLKLDQSPYKLRLGGIMHSARALWAMEIPYEVAYLSPEYLEKDIELYLKHHGCLSCTKIGNVTGSPYVFLIEEAKEVGNQGYEFLLRDKVKTILFYDRIRDLKNRAFDEILLISGNYNMKELIKKIAHHSSKLHIDIANNVKSLSSFKSGLKVETIFISTSSSIFKNGFKNIITFAQKFKTLCEVLVLKENRGGSRAINFTQNSILSISSQTQPVQHSVGVGDVYNAVYVCLKTKMGLKRSLSLASWAASEYAQTTFPDDFKKAIKRLLKTDSKDLLKLDGVVVPWEKRDSINIYIAAPDFDYLDTSKINTLCECLQYHNFRPRRPIKENGQFREGDTDSKKQELFINDMVLLEQCQILIVVLINNDPGTFIELGLAAGYGKPTLVYDPFEIAANCMLTQLPKKVSSNLDEILTEVFSISNRIINQ